MNLIHRIGWHRWHFVRDNTTLDFTVWVCLCGKRKYVDNIHEKEQEDATA